MSSRINKSDKQKDKDSIEQIAFLMETESDNLVNNKRDVWVSDITASSFGEDRLRLSQFLRAIAVAIRSFANVYLRK